MARVLVPGGMLVFFELASDDPLLSSKTLAGWDRLISPARRSLGDWHRLLDEAGLRLFESLPSVYERYGITLTAEKLSK